VRSNITAEIGGANLRVCGRPSSRQRLWARWRRSSAPPARARCQDVPI